MGRRIGYARVSTPEQKLDMQLDALRRAECDLIFSDHGVSGGTTERDGLQDALKILEPGDSLIVYKLCRLGRSVRHLTEIVAEFRQRDIEFQSLSEGIDTATMGGRLVFHIFAAVAEFQRDLISENTIIGLQAARARGKVLGRPRKLAA